jgi:6-phosphogluconolactonase
MADTPSGAGARHLVFSNDGNLVYVISEMGAAIHTYKWNDGHLSHLFDTSLLSDGMTEGKGAAIKISRDGKRIYATERATQAIVVLEADGERFKTVQRVDCHGEEPRDFLLLDGEKFAVCANQFSDNCSLFKVNGYGTLECLYSLDVKAPLCLVEVK